MVEPARRIPIHLENSFRDELHKMINLNVVKEVKEPTEWVNAVAVKKPNGSLRICLDPRHLNNNLLREYYYLPTFEEISCKMSGATIFSSLDAAQTYWQIRLSDQSTKYTTFNTPFGRYCFLKMAYGIKSAPEIFHRCFSHTFRHIQGVIINMDDLLIYAKSEKEHDEILEKVLKCAAENGIRFNKDKCRFKVKEIKFLGHVFSNNGLKSDADKVKAIL